MSMNFEKEFTNEGALISGEIILESFATMLDYYPLMLGSALRKLSEFSGLPVLEILTKLEEENNLVGVLQTSKNQLTAGREVLGSVINKIIQD